MRPGRHSSFTSEQVAAIRALSAARVPTHMLATRYGTSRRTIQRVLAGVYTPSDEREGGSDAQQPA